MSGLTIQTRHLVGMMLDLVQTASKEALLPVINSVLLFTASGEIMLEDRPPGDLNDEDASLIESATTSALVGWSTDRSIAAQAFAPCSGELHRMVLISVTSAKAIAQVFGVLAKKAPKSSPHEVTLTFEGGVLVVRENPENVVNPVALTVDVLDADPGGFPRLENVMSPDPGAAVMSGGEVVPPAYGIGLDPRHLEVIGRVAKRRKMRVVWYGHHHSRPVVGTVGAWYRVVVQPVSRELEGYELDEPQVPVFTPPRPDEEAGESAVQLELVSSAS